MGTLYDGKKKRAACRGKQAAVEEVD